MVGHASLAVGNDEVDVFYQLEEQRNSRMAGTLSLMLPAADQTPRTLAAGDLSIRLEDGRLFRFRVTGVMGRAINVAGTVGHA